MALCAVFFDLDDTLCDTIGSRPARARIAAELLATEHEHLRVEDLVERIMEPAGERTVRGVRRVVEDLDLAGTVSGKAALAGWFFTGCLNTLRSFDGVAETLQTLAPVYRLGVITNGDREGQQAKLAHLRLPIAYAITSGECGYEKPDPAIFHLALEQAGVAAWESVFVGDRLDVDVAGAKAAGMRAVWFNHFGGLPAEDDVRPDAVITRFSDLPAVLAHM